MELQTQHQESLAIIAMLGQFYEPSDHRILEEEVEKAVSSGCTAVAFDLERLTFINSQGLGVLVRIYSRLKESSIPLLLYRPAGHVREAIELSGFDGIMLLVETRRELEKAAAAARDSTGKKE